jgi:hypothetical protein
MPSLIYPNISAFSIQSIPHKLKTISPVIAYLIACDSYPVPYMNTLEMKYSEGAF